MSKQDLTWKDMLEVGTTAACRVLMDRGIDLERLRADSMTFVKFFRAVFFVRIDDLKRDLETQMKQGILTAPRPDYEALAVQAGEFAAEQWLKEQESVKV